MLGSWLPIAENVFLPLCTFEQAQISSLSGLVQGSTGSLQRLEFAWGAVVDRGTRPTARTCHRAVHKKAMTFEIRYTGHPNVENAVHFGWLGLIG